MSNNYDTALALSVSKRVKGLVATEDRFQSHHESRGELQGAFYSLEIPKLHHSVPSHSTEQFI